MTQCVVWLNVSYDYACSDETAIVAVRQVGAGCSVRSFFKGVRFLMRSFFKVLVCLTRQMSRNTRLVILAAYSHLVETVAIVDRIVIKGVVVY